ncbi:MAG: class I SAM-dependent methyltransferase [Planctomycetota bacterium]
MPTRGSSTRDGLMDVLVRTQEGEGYDSVAQGWSSRVILLRHVDIFLRYRHWITPGTILDWGCRHAPDSALIRASEDGEASTLHGCDVGPTRCAEAHAAIQLVYRPLEHPYQLPYDDATFDTVIGSGVLEHVPDDDASLRELHRVIKPGGRLIITFLPNRWSYTEWASRRLKAIHHRRLYARARFRRQLLSRGFWPLVIGHHQMLPSLAAKGRRFGKLNRLVEHAYALNGAAEQVPGLRVLASNLWAVAEKRAMM